ncbi:hypothetical protein HDU92_004325 [Lobulomyces angularis]|nr:hypothetical protein HDU92_004325 [Lobulomyces angularis]
MLFFGKVFFLGILFSLIAVYCVAPHNKRVLKSKRKNSFDIKWLRSQFTLLNNFGVDSNEFEKIKTVDIKISESIENDNKEIKKLAAEDLKEKLKETVTCELEARKKPFVIYNGDGESFDFHKNSIKLFIKANLSVSPITEQLLISSVTQPIVVPKIIHFLNYNPTFETLPYLCSLESAAFHNRDHKINIYVMNVKDFNLRTEAWLNNIEFKNRLNVLELNFKEVFLGTPFESWYNMKEHLKSHWQYQNLGNAFRLALIWKKGGIYLDMDIISINSFKDLMEKRLVAREDSVRVNNAVLSFPPNDPFIWSSMEVFVNNFNGYAWANNGPLCLTRAIMRDCYWETLKTGKIDEFEKYTSDYDPQNEQISKNLLKFENFEKRNYCKSIDIANRSRFYPVHYSQSSFFTAPWTENCNLLKQIYKKSVGIHWWNRMFKFKKSKTELSPNSTLAKIFNDQCPVYMKQFGVKKIG